MKICFIVFILLNLVTATIHAQTPISLLRETQEISPTEYYELSQEGERLYQQQSYAKAAEVYEKLTKAYPWEGEKWQRFASSLYRLGKFREAIPAFLKAAELGLPDRSQHYAVDIARSYARAGDNDDALNWLEKALRQFRFNQKPSLLNDPAFASLKDIPCFRELMGILPNRKFTRTEGWRYDVDYLLSEIKRVNPVYSKQPLPDEIIQAASRLKTQIPKLSDAQIMYEMQHLLVLLRQSHNSLFIPGKMVKLTQLPLTFYAFPEGLYIIDAIAPYEDLIGARVLRFDNTTAESALEATRYIIGRENEMAILSTGPDRLKILQLMHALRITSNPDRVDLTVIDRQRKTRTVSPNPVSLGSRQKLMAPRLPNTSAPPLYLSRPDEEFWFEYLPKDETIYLQYNQVDNKSDETLPQFGIRLRDFLAQNKVRNLIVDVRRNNGGSTFLDAELLRTLIEFDAKGSYKLFIFTGRYTFSAASNFITDVDRLTNAIFVGEPSGGKPIMVGGDESPIILPYSGVGGSIAATSWALTTPRDTRLWIAPSIPIVLTAKDYFSNRDALMETILTMLRKNTKQ